MTQRALARTTDRRSPLCLPWPAFLHPVPAMHTVHLELLHRVPPRRRYWDLSVHTRARWAHFAAHPARRAASPRRHCPLDAARALPTVGASRCGRLSGRTTAHSHTEIATSTRAAISTRKTEKLKPIQPENAHNCGFSSVALRACSLKNPRKVTKEHRTFVTVAKRDCNVNYC